jgi:hypothetical protein
MNNFSSQPRFSLPFLTQRITADFTFGGGLNTCSSTKKEIEKGLAEIDSEIQKTNDRLNEIYKINEHITAHNQ